MELLDDELARQTSPADESAIRKLNIESLDMKKDIRNGRTALIVLAAFSVVAIGIGLYQFNSAIGGEDTDPASILIEGLVLVLIYAGAAWLVKANPKVALLVGFGIFILYQLIYAVMLPSTIYRGILLKIFIVYYMVKAIMASFKFETLREKYRQYGLDLTI